MRKSLSHKAKARFVLGSLGNWLFFQLQADGVNAVTKIGGGVVAFAFEDVTHVGAAVRAQNLNAAQTEGKIFLLNDFVASKWGEEGRPTAVGFKLLGGAE